jgi:hypothetical protein
MSKNYLIQRIKKKICCSQVQDDLKRSAVSFLGHWDCYVEDPVVREKRRHILEDLVPCGCNAAMGLGIKFSNYNIFKI